MKLFKVSGLSGFLIIQIEEGKDYIKNLSFAEEIYKREFGPHAIVNKFYEIKPENNIVLRMQQYYQRD